MAYIDILILAAVAGFLGYRLWSILGTHDPDKPMKRKNSVFIDEDEVPILCEECANIPTVAYRMTREINVEGVRQKPPSHKWYKRGFPGTYIIDGNIPNS